MASTSQYPTHRQSVSEAQKYLRTIAHRDSTIPKIGIDGIYGTETADAVQKYQTQSGLPPTGEIDQTTWDRLYAQYSQIVKDESPADTIKGFPAPNMILMPGDTGDSVIFIQTMLRALGTRFQGLSNIVINGIYDQATTQAIIYIRRSLNLRGNGIDRQLWNSITNAYNYLI